MSDKPQILLHACCAPCTPHVLNLLSEKYKVSVFFYNPNIQPEQEYRLRENEIQDFSKHAGFKLLVGSYDERSWLDAVRGLEQEPEGGRRCDICFEFRLKAAAIKAQQLGIPFFTTTLTVSPLKNAGRVNEAGRRAQKTVEGPEFIEADFKKKDGFKISTELSKQHGFYRQNYCGCMFSKRD